MKIKKEKVKGGPKWVRVLLFALFLFPFALSAAASAADALLSAMIVVESGGDDRAVGDGGRSLGCLQITRACVRDVNRLTGSRHRWRDMTHRPRAVAVWRAYLAAYAPSGDAETMARVWNGGPEGARKPGTLIYWRRVRAVMEQQQAKAK